MTHLKYNPYEIGKSLKFAIKIGYLKGLLLDVLAQSRHLLYLLLFFYFSVIYPLSIQQNALFSNLSGIYDCYTIVNVKLY